MRSHIVRKWTAGAVGLLAIALALQVSLAYTIDVLAVHLTGEGWVTNAHVTELPEIVAAEVERARPERGRLDADALASAIARRDRQAVHAAMQPRDVPIWFAVSAPPGRSPEVVASSAPACASALASAWEDRAADQSLVFACDGRAVAVGGTPLGAEHAWFVHGVELGDAFLARIRVLSSTEATLVVDGTAAATTFRASDGRTVAPESIDPLPPLTGALVADRVKLEVPDYGGFVAVLTGDVYAAGSERSRWYVAAGPLDRNGRVVVALYAPVSVLSQGPHYALAILTIGSIVVLLGAGGIVRRLIRRYTGPLEELSESAQRVARGDLDSPVHVPDGHEMSEFCVTYNEMLERLDTLMRASNRLSREAGMAEVAIGVLHNVGNAMNSVSTGVGLAREALQALPTRRTQQLAELLRSHRDDLPEFLGQPGKADSLVDFVDGLARHLEQSRDKVRAELNDVTTAVGHAVAVIGAQQRHAKHIDAVETCRLRDVIEDAVRISGVERSDATVRVERDCDDAMVKIDRHRLLEILVNLIKNAADALRSSERGGGCIWITAGSTAAGIFVRVRDDGPGVPEHARSKIFAMGYTTKPDGHGFGLHASSNAAVEMGGALRLVPTDEGATFELTIGT